MTSAGQNSRPVIGNIGRLAVILVLLTAGETAVGASSEEQGDRRWTHHSVLQRLRYMDDYQPVNLPNDEGLLRGMFRSEN